MAVEQQPAWQWGEVVEVTPVADGVRRVVLAPDNPRHARPGAHVDVRLQTAGRTLTRSYSVVRSEDAGRRLVLSVRLAELSRGGSALVHAWQVGERVRMTQPLQNFALGVGAARYVLVAGGIGVTAVAAMATVLRARGVPYELVYVGRRRSAMPYVEELLEEHGEQLRLHVSEEGTPLDVDALVGEIAADDRAARTEAYVCGPIRLMDEVRRCWSRHDLPRPHLRFETFGNSGSWASQEFTVRIPRLDREIRVGTDSSMLDALEDAGVAVLADCRRGECGLCVVKVVDVTGEIDHRDVFLDDDQQRRGDRLCCCVSRAVSPQGADQADQAGASSTRPAVLTIDLP